VEKIILKGYEHMKKERQWDLAGCVFGIIVVIIGIWFIYDPAASYYTDKVRDCEFGADFYTCIYEATQTAVNNTASTAKNIRDLGEKIALYNGTFFIVAGILVFLHYGKSLCICHNNETTSECTHDN